MKDKIIKSHHHYTSQKLTFIQYLYLGYIRQCTKNFTFIPYLVYSLQQLWKIRTNITPIL